MDVPATADPAAGDQPGLDCPRHDNLESLLTDQGDWRDPRWGLVVDALVGHDGLSRVVLTSRRRPRTLDRRVRVEAVHALSLEEAMPVARELPNLRALMDSDAGRALLVRTLGVVQGHPKLIELANGQAADPIALAARLDEADQAWLADGAPLAAFFDHGESAATDDDYVRVLSGWTQAVATALPEPARILFQFLCGAGGGRPARLDRRADLGRPVATAGTAHPTCRSRSRR